MNKYLYKAYKRLGKVYYWGARKKRRFCNVFFTKYQSGVMYRGIFKREMSWDNPIEFNEKIHWLKINTYNNNPLITQCVDKYKVRDYIIPKDIVKCAELYGVYDSPEQIEWDKLPDRFVIKCNHGCGYNILCNDKSTLDKKETKKQLRAWLKEDYWKEYAEIQYKYVEKKIIVEEYLGDDIPTYKFYCFNGVPKVLYVSNMGEDGDKDKYIDYFDMDGNNLHIQLTTHPNAPYDIALPTNMDKLVEASRKLSADFPFVRVDLYDVNGEIYLSELTFIPTGGFMMLTPKETLFEWGKWLDISEYTNKNRDIG